MQTSFRINAEWEKRIENLISGTETISQFAYKAMEERVKRLEARNERSRSQIYEKDIKILTPIIEDILRRLGE